MMQWVRMQIYLLNIEKYNLIRRHPTHHNRIDLVNYRWKSCPSSENKISTNITSYNSITGANIEIIQRREGTEGDKKVNIEWYRQQKTKGKVSKKFAITDLK